LTISSLKGFELSADSTVNESSPLIAQTFNFHGDEVVRSLKIGDLVTSQRVSRETGITDPRIAFYRGYLSERVRIDSQKQRRVTYVDLFCGGGGLSLGVSHALRTLGYQPKLVLAADVDKSALNLVNHHFAPLMSRNTTVEEVVDYVLDHSGDTAGFITEPTIRDNELKPYRGKIDLLVGGPPCQGHSNFNNRTRGHDPRNLLYFVMPAIAIALKVPNIIIENVATIRRARENVVEKTSQILSSRGYSVKEIVLSAADFGVAQARQRHFLIASLCPMHDISVIATQLRQPDITFDDVTKRLPSIKFENEILETNPQLSVENIARIKYLLENDVYDLPNDQRPDCHREEHTYPSVYGRIRGNQPMQTVTTGFGTPGRGRYVHPYEPRTVNAREAARIQAFPDWFWEPTTSLGFTRNDFYKIIGDAVPSLLVEPLLFALAPALNHQ
jgi:DNA (cytosine-5)-methyltransferase 1